MNQTITFRYRDASAAANREEQNQQPPPFQLLDAAALGIEFNHQPGISTDRFANPLKHRTHSNLGPAMAVGDVNNDGLPDLYMGGGQDQTGIMYLQQPDGTFASIETPDFESHSHHQDIDAVFF